MIQNQDEPAFPVEVAYRGDVIRGQQTGSLSGWATGLTKREYFAALAMQGIMANDGYGHGAASRAAAGAVEHADALLEALKAG